MARTIPVIYDAIILEKETFNALDTLLPLGDNFEDLLIDINSPSKVAIWRLWAFVIAVSIFVLETLWDVARVEIQDQAEATITGTEIWWRNEALLFQFGDDLVFNGKKFVYQVIDPTKQIVAQAAVVTTGRQIRIKVVKENNVPLDTAELAAFIAYINQISFAGTNPVGISQVPDLLKVFYRIIYDPLVLQADGSLISDPAVFPVEDAINSFLTGLDFNGALVLTKMTDAVQAAEGVIDPILLTAEAKFAALPYAPIVDSYLTNGGNIVIDTVSFPLSATTTYVANV